LKKKRIFLIPIPHPRCPAEVNSPAKTDLPQPPVQPSWPVSFLAEWRRVRTEVTGCPADPDPDPNPTGVRPWLPRTPSPHACPEPTWMEIAGRLPTEGNKNQILTDYLSIPSPNPKFSWRLGSGCCCALTRAFAPINRILRRPPKHFSLLPLPFPNRAIGAVPTRSLPRQAKPQRRLPEPLRSRRS
jgi:hypothetical protein